MNLPFWDDFSFNIPSTDHPHDSLWQFGHSVWVNTGMGINPPTFKVASFDGIDSTGLPYNINLPLAKGVADRLTSRQIRMDLVDPLKRDSVFIFFYYQFQGNGEAPDPGDDFSLWFKNDSSVWVKVWTDTVKVHDNTKFVPVKFYVSDPHYFHSAFQFRFQNFGRLSGPFDNWNLDYVYVSNGKNQYPVLDPSGNPIYYSDFPDRAIATPMTSIVQQYYSIPAKHLLSKGDSLLNKPTLTLTNQRKDQASPRFQPTSLITRLRTTTRLDKSVNHGSIVKLDSVPGILVYYGAPTVVSLNTLPSFASMSPHIDSIAMKFYLKLNSGDHVNKIDANTGDYDTVVYKPIEFRYNDSTSTNFVFSNYYAYDDGVAEYAATLTQAGNYLAYEFDMAYSKPDTLIAVDIYFPHVGDESNQVIQLMVFKKLTTPIVRRDTSAIAVQDVTVSRTENDKLTRVKLDTALVISDKFYIGYKQNSSAVIGIGLDKNSDSGNKIFANLGTGWLLGGLYGNLMIRPVFGSSTKVKGVVTAVEEKKAFVYPNPNHGVFYFPQTSQSISIADIAGRAVSFTQEDSFEATRVALNNPAPGIYIVRYFNGTKWQTDKIMVLQ
jgi:hypothetical protein